MTPGIGADGRSRAHKKDLGSIRAGNTRANRTEVGTAEAYWLSYFLMMRRLPSGAACSQR